MAAPLAIRAAAWHLPERRVETADLPERATLSHQERETYDALGIERLRLDDELSAHDLALRATREVMARAGLGPADVDALIVVEPRAPEELVTSEATRLQEALKVSGALAFSVGGLGCATLTPALLAARGLLAADEELTHILIAHGSKPATPGRYRHPVTLNGDGGQALVLGRTGLVRVLDVVQETNGAYWDLFRVAYRDRPAGDWREECRDLTAYSFRLAVESRNRLRDLLRRLLDRNGMRPRDVRGYIGQNLSAGGHAFMADVLGAELIPACHENLRNYGHLGPGDVLLNLYSGLESKELAEGERAVLINMSPVAAWSLLLVEIGDDGDRVHYL
ncbi:3-oxoacyl-ACP synthase [Streptomyces sp. NBRC 110028]|uniref:3-oxoacyl-ACP synthase n=1 Tax=Streptomyces sp. NBRC 110028 TaxID=1621260 RepID=UPI0006E310B9|nr:3-oxoacyl-ACP synthase [Streptomyces sp. NBRC 110028]